MSSVVQQIPVAQQHAKLFTYTPGQKLNLFASKRTEHGCPAEKASKKVFFCVADKDCDAMPTPSVKVALQESGLEKRCRRCPPIARADS